MTSELTEFLLARIAEDEKWARGRRDEDFRKHRVGRRAQMTPDAAERVLARCAAYRKIVAESRVAREEHGAAGLRLAIAALASEYAGHPDYDVAWRP